MKSYFWIRKSSIRGFTLVELLIVIAIILILAGLLLPALQGARARAKAVVCLSNLHNIGLLLTLYEQEFNGFPGIPSYPLLHRGYGGGTGTSTVPACVGNGAAVPYDQRPLTRYALQQGDTPSKAINIFQCPADVGEENCSPSTGVPMWKVSGTSYHYNSPPGCCGGEDMGALFDYNGKGIRLASVIAPARKAVLYESQFRTTLDCASAMNNRHYFKGGTSPFLATHMLFVDGSARYVVRDKYAGPGFTGGPLGPNCSASTIWPVGSTTGPDPLHDYY